MASVALVTVHGMGKTDTNYADELFNALRPRLGADWDHVDRLSVYYQNILQKNEELVWERTKAAGKVRYDDLRMFVLFGFGDAAGLENGKEEDGSVYEQAQGEIARTLLDACTRNGPGTPICFVTHSLGCQVLSSYLYDANKPGGTSVGIWRDIDGWANKALGRSLTSDEKTYLRATTCMAWVTTGCNIPIFVAAHIKGGVIKPINPPSHLFKWLNLYDPDDVLGWPLAPLYGEQPWLEDRAINAGHGLANYLLRSWNPASHTAYWTDADVVNPVAGMLKKLVS